jgi:hypothetical protein
VVGGGKAGDYLGGSQFDGIVVRLERQANNIDGQVRKVRQMVG